MKIETVCSELPEVKITITLTGKIGELMQELAEFESWGTSSLLSDLVNDIKDSIGFDAE
jgi:hypothetical protein